MMSGMSIKDPMEMTDAEFTAYARLHPVDAREFAAERFYRFCAVELPGVPRGQVDAIVNQLQEDN
jgi:hypothetical protein